MRSRILIASRALLPSPPGCVSNYSQTSFRVASINAGAPRGILFYNRPTSSGDPTDVNHSGLGQAHIAWDWNAKHNLSKVGFVTRFRVRNEYLHRYKVQTVGGSMHQEYWIPAEELDEFNRNLVGRIEVVAEYNGDDED